MASSRYRNINLIDKSFYETSDFPDQSKLDNIATFQIVASRFDRLDNLAFKHLGDGEYWWIIALFNNIDWMYGFDEGQILKIPSDVKEVLKLF
jgi:hypothetical protein